MDVDVRLAAWEVECCQPAPRIGALVTWPLRWYASGEVGSVPAPVSHPWTRSRLRLGPAEHQVGTVLELGALVAWSSCGEDDVPDPGVLAAEHHASVPDVVPLTTGRVQALAVVGETYRFEADQQEWRPVQGRTTTRRVWRTPTFDHGVRPVARGSQTGEFLRETGLVVSLQVEPRGDGGS